MSLWWIIPVAGAFVVSLFFVAMVRRLAPQFGLVDVGGGVRKLHQGLMPLGGGIGVYGAFALITLIVFFATNHFVAGAIEAKQIFGFLLGGAVLIVGGVLDDLYDLRPRHSILFPLLAVAVAVASGIGVSKLTNPLGGFFEIGQAVSAVLTFVWLMGMIYTTKLLDGVDGLASGVVGIGGLVIAALALSTAFYQPDVALLSLIAVAAIGGFFVWNWHPASIFLGEGGSTFLGYLLGVLAVISGSKIMTALLIIGIPALDVLFVIYSRARGGVNNVTTADTRHLHHRLLAAGLSQRQVVLLYFAFSFIFGITTLIFESWQKVIALLILFFVVFLFLYSLSTRKV